MNLILVRHGESEADLINVLEARADYNLTNKGLAQAKLLGEWIGSNEKIDFLLSSPLKRANQTANEISKVIHKDIITVESLKEWNNGELAGLSREVANKKYPIPEGGKKPHHEIANSESLIDFRARIEKAYYTILENYNEDVTLCIVAHGGVINMLFQSIMEMPSVSKTGICCNDTSVHKFEIRKHDRKIHYLNKVEHLIVD